MVMRSMFFFLLGPLFLFSGEFTATISRDHLHFGESVVLSLTLKDASARGVPSLNPLKKSFIIHSQQQTSNTVVVNGKSSSSLTWKIALVPQEAGDLEIPPIAMDTSEGVLRTQSIIVHVAEGSTSLDPHSSEIEDVIFEVEISNDKPYKNEPFIYTTRLISKKNLVNLQFNKSDIKDAMVENNGEPKIYHKIVNGVRLDIIEFSYVVTPLKPGVLTIAAATIQGGIPVKRKSQNRSLFDRDFDPFLMMQGFDQIEPFILKTEAVSVDVQPAVAGMFPWIPATSFKIEEECDASQTLKAGDPFTRSFTITAEGVKSGQIPSLQDLQGKNSPFQIYADTPQLGDEVKEGHLQSYRKEVYTLIPQQSGPLTLPEISLTWWDVVKKERRTVLIPSRTLQVAPAVKISANDLTSSNPEPQVVIVQKDPILYIIIASLACMLIGAVFLGYMLQKKIARLTDAPQTVKKTEKKEEFKPCIKVESIQKPPKKEKKEKLPDLNPT
jgi:hypothetical protein